MNKKKLLMRLVFAGFVLMGAFFILTKDKNFSIRQIVKGREISMIFLPSVSSEVVEKNGKLIADDLAKRLNMDIKPLFPISNTAVIEELGKSKRESFAYMGAFGCITANKKYNATIALVSKRNNLSWYKSAFFVLRNSPYNKLEDLKGKRWAHPEHSSTSGYIFPKYILTSRGINTSEDISVGTHPQSILALLSGKVDFVTAYFIPPGELNYWQENDDPEKGIYPQKEVSLNDARSSLLEQFPNIVKDVRILEVTENIPNECIIFSNNINDVTVNKISEGIISQLNTDSGKSFWSDKNFYKVDGFEKISSHMYDDIKKVMQVLNLDIKDLK